MANEVEVFRWVSDVYNNCRSLLSLLPSIMQDKGIYQYNWANHYEFDGISGSGRAWENTRSYLIGYLFRQFYEGEKRDKDLITFGCAPWRWSNSDHFTPVFYGTRCALNKNATNGDNVYWIGALPIWVKENDSSGEVKEYDSGATNLAAAQLQKFQERVANDRLFGVATPLYDIRNKEDIEKKIINPLLQQSSGLVYPEWKPD